MTTTKAAQVTHRVTRQLLATCAWAVLAAWPAHAERIVGASYAQPVDRYGHHALGRPHEYGRVVATTDTGREERLELPADEVFEDLAPRLVRLAADAPGELLVIVSSRSSGSRLALVGLKEGRLRLEAQSDPIGTPNRWLNPVGVADLDGDGVGEIVAVTTPHVGGVLRVYRRAGARLVEIASSPGFSNHVYGSAELGLSRVASIGGHARLLVPDARRTSVRVMALRGGQLVETARCPLAAPITGPQPLRACESELAGTGSPAR